MYTDDGVDDEEFVEFNVAMWVGLCLKRQVEKELIIVEFLYGLFIRFSFDYLVYFYMDLVVSRGFTKDWNYFLDL